MKRFAHLYQQLDRTTRTSEKLAALEAYFTEVPPEDAIWALHFLTGRRIKRALPYKLLQDEAATRSGYPPWLVSQCRQMVGDLSETISLLLPHTPNDTDPPSLHELVEDLLLPLPISYDQQKRKLLNAAWDRLDPWQRFVFHKLLSGALRVGVAERLVIRGFAAAVNAQPEDIAYRLTGHWDPTPETYRRIVEGDTQLDALRPYPFCLATPHEGTPETLGDPADFQAEWKWDGIRGQLIHRQNQVGLWSRGDAAIQQAFPELADAARQLPDGTVLDGEILAWDHDNHKPQSFNALQKRLNRIDVRPTLFGPEIPVVFRAYDLLEHEGQDLRPQPLTERRTKLEAIINDDNINPSLLTLSPTIPFTDWSDLTTLREQSRDRAVEGLMLKRLDSPYGTGRKTGLWWKWKVAPHTVDAVMIYAQRGHGERAGVFSDYTFAVWDDNNELVPVTKAYSGLTNEEIDKVSRWVRKNTLDRRGPIHRVNPQHVFEIAFEGIQASARHRSGVALRFPRMLRWRTDKQPEDADRLATLKKLLDAQSSS
ncbi:ATP-dependent DNA ligase [Mucisphaera sp.]|uniref:ATP-dependent DNA ligase n=1 Tax=Mucisphaera sp. TaxID=2913024 RepID=UPI003D102A45